MQNRKDKISVLLPCIVCQLLFRKFSVHNFILPGRKYLSAKKGRKCRLKFGSKFENAYNQTKFISRYIFVMHILLKCFSLSNVEELITSGLNATKPNVHPSIYVFKNLKIILDLLFFMHRCGFIR